MADIHTEPMTYETPNAVQIHIELDRIEPKVWRRLVLPLSTNLAQLHYLLQAAFGWTDSHLHHFLIGGLRFGDAEFAQSERLDSDEPRTFELAGVRMQDFSFYHGDGISFQYIYDFGDNWTHKVTFEKLLAITPAPKTASCTGGARCCPPEDVGGPGGYAEFLRVLLNPEEDEIEEQKHLKRWSGGRFDPERFDRGKTDKAVRGALRKRRRDGVRIH